MRSLKRSSRGWTLTELLIAVAIISILFFLVWFGMKRQIDRGYDTRRKTDLDSISKAFEEYYNDNDCYPPAGILDNCGGSALSPYLEKIPCDPAVKTPYLYVPEADVCDGHRVCASLRDTSDSAIGQIGCDPVEGCGWGAGYNFCRGSGVAIVAPGFVPGVTQTPTPPPGGGGGSTPTPTPTSTPGGGGGGGNFACTPGGQCNIYADPQANGCPVTFFDPTCNNMCIDPANRCLQ